MTKKRIKENSVPSSIKETNSKLIPKKNGKNKTRKTEREVHFHWDLWLLLALDNWILDFGRPIVAMIVPLDWIPLDMPSVGDYFHMIYNIITPFCLLKLLDRQKVSSSWIQVCVIVFVMGASMHLVGDSVNHRLIHLGFKNHLSVADNPIMKQLQPPQLVKSFELLYRYDEQIGHLLWYIPFFLCLFLYFCSCFHHRLKIKPDNRSTWTFLVVVSAAYYWYLATEGQISPLFLAVTLSMVGVYVVQTGRGLVIDVNGSFLLWTFLLTVILTSFWSYWLWEDQALRRKYPGVFYVPEPWAYYTLYILK